MATRTLGVNAGANVTKTPKSIVYTLAELMNDVVALANELRTDHATFKTQADAVETLIEELSADHATAVTWMTEVAADHETAITWMTEVDADEDAMNDRDSFFLADSAGP